MIGHHPASSDPVRRRAVLSLSLARVGYDLDQVWCFDFLLPSHIAEFYADLQALYK